MAVVRKVEVVPYDPAWPGAFTTEAAVLLDVLGPTVISIDHIGSTAIPGLAAKPTIDILLVVRALEFLDRFNSTMRELGYQPKGENGIGGRRYFQKLMGEFHLFHIHAFESCHADITRHMNFRDYLRVHPAEALTYQALKLRLAEEFPFEARSYTKGKTDFILALDRRAAAWQARHLGETGAL